LKIFLEQPVDDEAPALVPEPELVSGRDVLLEPEQKAEALAISLPEFVASEGQD
jgi:hypothetical protein